MKADLSTIQGRIKHLIKTEGVSQAEFADAIFLKPQVLNNKLAGRSDFSLDEISIIAERVPGLSMEWLIRGLGCMYIIEENEKLLKKEFGEIHKAISIIQKDNTEMHALLHAQSVSMDHLVKYLNIRLPQGTGVNQ